jgi:hypothetical protein
MNRSITVARFHLASPLKYLAAPWYVMGFTFALCVVVFALIPVSHHNFLGGPATLPAGGGRYTNAVFDMFFFVFVLGVQSIAQSLPFGLTLGASRRSFYSGTALLGMALSATFALGITALQAIERATGGWGLSLHFFRVPGVLNGPWYDTWLTSFVLLSVLFSYGMWYGIVYRRWAAPGVLLFIGLQFLVGWAVRTAVGGHVTSLSALDVTGLAAALAVVLLAGGYATARRVTV